MIRLSTFILKNLRQLFDKYAVARTEHDALVKSTTKIFSNFVAFSENPNFNRCENEALKKSSVIFTSNPHITWFQLSQILAY